MGSIAKTRSPELNDQPPLNDQTRSPELNTNPVPGSYKTLGASPPRVLLGPLFSIFDQTGRGLKSIEGGGYYEANITALKFRHPSG